MKTGTGMPEKNTETMTIGMQFHRSAIAFGDKPALVYRDPEQIITFRELDAASDAVAKSLIASGIPKGAHAALFAPNMMEWVIVFLGCAKAGVPLVVVNTGFRASDLEYTLHQADAHVLFLAPGSTSHGAYAEIIYEICPELKTCKPGTLKAPRLPLLKTVVTLSSKEHPGMIAWQGFLARGENVSAEDLHTRENSVKPDEGFVLFLTSGTTGKPKCAFWNHEQFLANVFHHSDCLGLVPDDICCTPLPFFHAYGCEVLMSALTCGCTIAPIQRFSAGDFLRTIGTFHVTHIFGTPTMFVATLDEFGRSRYTTSSLKGGNTAGSVCQPSLIRAVIETLGAREFGIIYGLSEEICVTMTHHLDPIAWRAGSIGKPGPGKQIKIVSPLTGAEVAPGESGELLVKSLYVMTGYYHNPQATAAAIDADGFFHTGDLGMVDPEGNYHITGRSKDLIIRGGENISPSEIEEILRTHPAVLDAQVVGMPSDYFGEEPVGFIRLKAGTAATALELKQFCRRNIAIDKVPAIFFFVDQYPLTASGKVQKFRLREMAAEMLSEENR